jgi:hypothetical protein
MRAEWARRLREAPEFRRLVDMGLPVSVQMPTPQGIVVAVSKRAMGVLGGDQINGVAAQLDGAGVLVAYGLAR